MKVVSSFVAQLADCVVLPTVYSQLCLPVCVAQTDRQSCVRCVIKWSRFSRSVGLMS